MSKNVEIAMRQTSENPHFFKNSSTDFYEIWGDVKGRLARCSGATWGK